MEFLTGVKEKETLDIGQIVQGDYEGRVVKINGSIHNIRDMGEVAFVILRKAGGLVQCVYEEGKTGFDLKDLREEAAVEVTGKMATEPRAPHGFESRTKFCPLPFTNIKCRRLWRHAWKCVRSPCGMCGSGQSFGFRRGSSGDFGIFFTARDLRRFTRPRSWPKGRRAAPTCFGWIILTKRRNWPRVPSFISRLWWECLIGCLRWLRCFGRRSTIRPGISTSI